MDPAGRANDASADMSDSDDEFAQEIVIGQNHHPRPMFSIWGNGWSCRVRATFDVRAESTRAYGTSWRVVVHHR
jgi:hypothetical protein